MNKKDLNNIKTYYEERQKYDNSFISKLSHKQRLIIHPLLLSIIKLRNKSNGFEISVIDDNRIATIKPKIFCITHIGKFDIEVVSEIIGEHYYLLSGDFENIKGTIEEKFLGFNGVVYVREDDKEDRKQSKEKMVNILKNNGNLMYFPEGTWNLTPNLPVVQCPYGIIEVAMKGNATIIPVAIEQYDKNFICKIGKNFDVDKYNEGDKLSAIMDLRDILATLKWEIWESMPALKTRDMVKENFKKYIQERLQEWPNFSYEEFNERIFKPKGITNEKEVFEFLSSIELEKNNAFLAKTKNEYVKQYVMKK